MNEEQRGHCAEAQRGREPQRARAEACQQQAEQPLGTTRAPEAQRVAVQRAQRDGQQRLQCFLQRFVRLQISAKEQRVKKVISNRLLPDLKQTQKRLHV